VVVAHKVWWGEVARALVN